MLLMHHGKTAALPAILEEALEDSDSDDGYSSCGEADEDDWGDRDGDWVDDYDYEGIMAALCGGHDADGHDDELDKRCRGGVTCDDASLSWPACWQSTPAVKHAERAAGSRSQKAACSLLKGVLDAIPSFLSRRSRTRIQRANTY